MLSNSQIYGTEDVPPVPKEVADERIRLLRLNLKKNMDMPMEEQSTWTQTRILDAISFWRKLSHQEDVGL